MIFQFKIITAKFSFLNKILFLLNSIFIFSLVNDSFAQLPAYILRARNFTYFDSITNQIEFDITIEHTNPPVEFIYTGGRYYIAFNPLIANGGILTYEYVRNGSSIVSDIPQGMIPRNPTISTASNPTEIILRLSYNAIPGIPEGFYITNNGYPGTRIVRMRLKTSAPSFAFEYLNFKWRNPPAVEYSTGVSAYIVFTNTWITTPETHIIDSSGFGGPLPVELNNFNSFVQKENVTLNWSTFTEINNSGFDIERTNSKFNTPDEWSKISFKHGSGTTNEIQNYSFNENLKSGNYKYRLKQIDYNGNYEYFYLSNEVVVESPTAYKLFQNFPNPFNPETRIRYELPFEENVKIVIYDISGKEVQILVNEIKSPGYHSIHFDGSSLSGGVYFYRLSAGDFSAVRKMVFLK